jgi:hypothetical protein
MIVEHGACYTRAILHDQAATPAQQRAMGLKVERVIVSGKSQADA